MDIPRWNGKMERRPRQGRLGDDAEPQTHSARRRTDLQYRKRASTRCEASGTGGRFKGIGGRARNVNRESETAGHPALVGAGHLFKNRGGSTELAG
jgi:hypothetical protein